MIYSIAQVLAHEVELSNSPARPTHERRQKGLKHLRISVASASLHFKSLDDFSFAIESRTSVPSERFDDLLKRSPSELWDEAENIKLVEKNLVDIL